nr:aromatic amino acid transport family protein [Ornithinimicrobium sp. F0845]
MVRTAERDHLAALRAGEALPAPPRIQHLERSAEAWAHLVPAAPAVRAGLAHALTAKYAARARDVPGLRRAVGFEDPEVVAEHVRRHGTAPDAGWADTLPWAERLRWRASGLADRVGTLPAFWSAFALTLTQTVGAGVLALPIAIAGIGPLWGLALIVVIGLANVLTVTAIAEAVTRTGAVRWAGAFLGGVVRQHLGRQAAAVTAAAVTAFAVATLVAYYLGLSTTLAAAVGLPATVWVGMLFALTAALAWSGRMGATIVSALLIGAVNLLVIALLVAVTLTAFDLDRLTGGAGSRDGIDVSAVGAVFGVVLMSFFGHTAVAAGARDILRRDPGGRGLIRGTAAAMLVAILVYAVWTLVVAGAVDGGRLVGESGTVLEALTETVGPVVMVLGSVFAVTAMGMGAVHSSVGLHAQAAELLRTRVGSGRLPAMVPLVAVFLLVEVLLVTGRASFTGALATVGTLAVPVLAGTIPVLLLASARRRGDYVPTGALPGLGVPVLLGLWVLFAGGVAAHGLVIWGGVVARVLAGLVVVLICVLTAVVLRAGVLDPLSTLEVRRDRDLGLDTIQLTTAGRSGRAEVVAAVDRGRSTAELLEGSLRLPEQTTTATVQVATAPARQLRVWAHEVDPFGVSQDLPVEVLVGPPAAGAAAATGPAAAGPASAAAGPASPAGVGATAAAGAGATAVAGAATLVLPATSTTVPVTLGLAGPGVVCDLPGGHR